MDLTKYNDAEICEEVEAVSHDAFVRELLSRFNEQGLKLVAQAAALPAIAETAANLQTERNNMRNEVLEEAAVELDRRRKEGFWAIGDAQGNHVRDQSFIRAVCAVREMKVPHG